jgi:uncharacterized RDD family membrane protein YckC
MAMQTTFNPEYAGFWRRIFALCIDYAVIYLPILYISYFAGYVLRGHLGYYKIVLVGIVIGLVMAWLYWTLCESSPWQASLGKRLMGICVSDIDGERLTFSQSGKRTLCKVLSLLPFGLGFVAAAFTAKKQTLHDLITDSIVVYNAPQRKKKRSKTKIFA